MLGMWHDHLYQPYRSPGEDPATSYSTSGTCKRCWVGPRQFVNSGGVFDLARPAFPGSTSCTAGTSADQIQRMVGKKRKKLTCKHGLHIATAYSPRGTDGHCSLESSEGLYNRSETFQY